MSGIDPQAQPVLRVEGLTTEFALASGIVHAVQDVSFELRPREALGVIGESGSGKSVTAASIMRLIPSPPGRIVSGRILFHGDDLLELSEREMRRIRGGEIAMVFQDPLTSLNPLLSIGRQLTEMLRAHRPVTGAAAARRATELLELVGIPEPGRALNRYPHELSGGMRQRVMIAMAMSCEPKVLIADEPTTALDVTTQAQILELIRALRHEFSTAIIWISHDLGVVAGLCDRVNVMYAGRIVESGSVEQVLESPRHPYTLALLQCAPRMDLPRVERLEPIPGAPPNLQSRIEGCAFAPRCPYVMDRCRVERPDRMPVGAGHTSACWADLATAVR